MRNVLTLREQLTLSKLMEEHYAASGLDDVKFAEQMNKEHGALFRQPVTRSHILNARAALNIPPNRPRHAAKQMDAGECLGLIARVQALEERVEKLAATLKGLMK